MDQIKLFLEYNTPSSILDWEITKGSFPNSFIVSIIVTHPSSDDCLDVYQALIDMACTKVLKCNHIEKVFIEVSCPTATMINNLCYMCDVEKITDSIIKTKMYNSQTNNTKEKYINL